MAERRVKVAVAVATVTLAAAGVAALVADRGSGDGRSGFVAGAAPSVGPVTSESAAAAVVTRYYAALQHNDATTAYTLLCSTFQVGGQSGYVGNVAQDEQAGTGIAAWSEAHVRVQEPQAAVTGVLVLDDQAHVDITIRLVRDQPGTGWLVCGSDLGGVLPGPPPGAAPAPTPSGVTV